MTTMILHVVGSVTYFVGIILLSNTVKQVYVNEILYQSGVTAKARIVKKSKKPYCGINKFQRHYISVEFIIHSAQSIICQVTFKVTRNMYNMHLESDFLQIIYAKQNDRFYHNIKERMFTELKPMTLYKNILFSMLIISFYPFLYFLSAEYTFITFSLMVILCVISTLTPHHYHCDFKSNTYSINRMANTKDLTLFGFNMVATDIESSSDISMEKDINSESQTTSNINDVSDASNSNNCQQQQQDENNEIIDKPQEAIAILYESYMAIPQVANDSSNNNDDFIMVFK
eukprot:25402_1